MPCSSCPLLLAGTSRRYKGTTVAEGRSLPSAKELALMSVTFLLVVLSDASSTVPKAYLRSRHLLPPHGHRNKLCTYLLPEMRTDST